MDYSNHQNDLLNYLRVSSSLDKQRKHRIHHEDWAFQNFEDLLLTHALFMPPAPKPPEIEPGPPQYCYSNAQNLLSLHDNLTYVEGYAIHQTLFPVRHAWLMTSEGAAVDPTWPNVGLCYFGIPFQTSWMRTFIAARVDQFGEDSVAILEGNFLEQGSLLREGLPIEALHPLAVAHLTASEASQGR